MSTLREALREYLALRRSLDFKMQEASRVLPRFVAFMDERQAPHITTQLALEWVLQAKTVKPAERARRLGFIRGFARFRSATDPFTEVPSPELLPYLYTDQDVRGLLEAALQLSTRSAAAGADPAPQAFAAAFGRSLRRRADAQ
jgi:integrase/recombinase XerD